MKKWETVASVLKFHASLDADARDLFPHFPNSLEPVFLAATSRHALSKNNQICNELLRV